MQSIITVGIVLREIIHEKMTKGSRMEENNKFPLSAVIKKFATQRDTIKKFIKRGGQKQILKRDSVIPSHLHRHHQSICLNPDSRGETGPR